MAKVGYLTLFQMGQIFTPLTVSGLHVENRLNSRKRMAFNDARLDSCWRSLSDLMFSLASVVVHQLAQSASEMERYYRFLRNKKVSVREMIKRYCEFQQSAVAGRHVLVLGDSTSFNFKSHMGRITDAARMGVLDNNKTPGFFAHVGLAVDAATKDVLGMSDCILWTRKKAAAKAARTKAKAVDAEKESQKWALCAQNSHAALHAAAQTTFVFDADADAYVVFEAIGKLPNAHFVIRACHDRYVEWQGQRLKTGEVLRQAPVLATRQIELPALDHYSSTSGKRVKRAARQATIEFRSCEVRVPPPPGSQGEPLSLWVVEALETTATLPPGEAPVHWVLMTDHPVHDAEQAIEIVGFYIQRWVIEQLFRTMKSEGLRVEASELETFDAILRQTVMAFQAASRILQLVYARNRHDSQPIEQVFDPQECEVLRKINLKFQRTTKQFNPFPQNQLSWATFIIAWLGGWKGNLSQSPPGPTTLIKGLAKFTVYVSAFSEFADDA